MPSEMFATPRAIPGKLLPALGGTAVVALALPVFLIAGWPIASWAIAAGLWIVFLAIGLVLEHLPLGMDSLASAGVVAFGRMFRAGGLVGILIAHHRQGLRPRVSGRDRVRARVLGRVRAVAARVFRRGGRDVRLKRLVVALTGLALALPTPALARGDFDPSDEFELKDWVPIHLGPLDLSINKAVVYLLIVRGDHLPDRDRLHALEALDQPGSPSDVRRGDLRHRPDPGRRDGPAGQGIALWFPYVRDADDLHLGDQPPRLHPAAAHRRDLPRRPGVGDLRGDVVDLGHARALAHDLDLHRTSRASASTGSGQVLQVVDPRGAEGDPADDHRRSRCCRSSCA